MRLKNIAVIQKRRAQPVKQVRPIVSLSVTAIGSTDTPMRKLCGVAVMLFLLPFMVAGLCGVWLGEYWKDQGPLDRLVIRQIVGTILAYVGFLYILWT